MIVVLMSVLFTNGLHIKIQGLETRNVGQLWLTRRTLQRQWDAELLVLGPETMERCVIIASLGLPLPGT